MTYSLIIDIIVKIIFLQLFTLLMLFLMRKLTSEVRYQFMRIALIFMIIIPLSSIFNHEQESLIHIDHDFLYEINGDDVHQNPISNDKMITSARESSVQKISMTETQSKNSNTLSISRFSSEIYMIYFSIIFVFILRFIWGSIQLKLLKDQYIVFESFNKILKQLSIDREVKIYLSDKIISPMTWGFINHLIILPRVCKQWKYSQIDMTLMHESIHIKRYDYFMNIISYSLLMIFWFNPLSYVFYKRFRVEQEASCDELVVNQYNSTKEYANHLIQIARMLVSKKEILKPGVHMLNKKQLPKRIEHIFKSKEIISNYKKWSIGLPMIFSLMFVLMSFKTIGISNNNEINSLNNIIQKNTNLFDSYKNDFKPSGMPIARVKFTITSNFGETIQPFGKSIIHQGIDIACASGTDVYATADGLIKIAEEKNDFGNHIEIEHTNDDNSSEYVTRFSHLSKIIVKKGQKVKKGDKIGEVGNTGKSTNPHLHYEVLFKGINLDPREFMPKLIKEIKRVKRDIKSREDRINRVELIRTRAQKTRVQTQDRREATRINSKMK